MDKNERYADDTTIFTLDETIQNYNNVGALMDKADMQMLEWLEELRDLRQILSIDIPNPPDDDDTAFGSIEEAIQHFAEEEKATGETGFKQLICWLERVKEARERISEDILP